MLLGNLKTGRTVVTQDDYYWSAVTSCLSSPPWGSSLHDMWRRLCGTSFHRQETRRNLLRTWAKTLRRQPLTPCAKRRTGILYLDLKDKNYLAYVLWRGKDMMWKNSCYFSCHSDAESPLCVSYCAEVQSRHNLHLVILRDSCSWQWRDKSGEKSQTGRSELTEVVAVTVVLRSEPQWWKSRLNAQSWSCSCVSFYFTTIGTLNIVLIFIKTDGLKQLRSDFLTTSLCKLYHPCFLILFWPNTK